MKGTHANTMPIAIDVPWSENLTGYDRAHLVTYLRILDALKDDASIEEMARIILDLDPVRDPETARRAVDSHARRARWLTYRTHLFFQQH